MESGDARDKGMPSGDAVERIRNVLGTAMTEAGLRAWLHSRSAYLGWQRPIDVLSEPAGLERVVDAARAFGAGDST
jgi:uncharacterized protein (DUF2384 family)